ncbi:ubiquitin-like protein 7 [Melanaphis sacchari]|uniref:Ubiquitin-like protein 7 n=1 Tax=Melanaphis sacchari TaxID=742174 RepID=A0A2H8TSP9_9HEMI|nr:ubiquitin-like protein 7 [Melanaphis sacchari]
MLSEEPEISLINVKLRLGTMTMYTEKVYIDLQSHVSVLRHKICEKDNTLNKDNFVMAYSGNIMEDSVPIYMYDIINGATVHLFKKVNLEKTQPLKYIDNSNSGLMKLGVAFRSLSLNISYKCALMKINKIKLINDLLLNTPQLNEDPIAVTLLQHSELLVKVNDVGLVKRIAEKHPALALAALKISAVVREQVVQNHLASDVLARSISAASDEEIEDLDDSSPGSDTNSQPINRNLPFAITAAQLATAIANVTTQQPQPSTSGASTSTGNTGNVLVTPNNVPSQPTIPTVDYSHQLGIMREMGLYNESLNLQGLRLGGGHLETAIELVLSGFDISDTDNNT